MSSSAAQEPNLTFESPKSARRAHRAAGIRSDSEDEEARALDFAARLAGQRLAHRRKPVGSDASGEPDADGKSHALSRSMPNRILEGAAGSLDLSSPHKDTFGPLPLYEDVKTVYHRERIPYIESVSRKHRKAYLKALALAKTIASKRTSRSWSGLTLIFGNSGQMIHCLRRQILNRRSSRGREVSASAVDRRADSKNRYKGRDSVSRSGAAAVSKSNPSLSKSMKSKSRSAKSNTSYMRKSKSSSTPSLPGADRAREQKRPRVAAALGKPRATEGPSDKTSKSRFSRVTSGSILPTSSSAMKTSSSAVKGAVGHHARQLQTAARAGPGSSPPMRPRASSSQRHFGSSEQRLVRTTSDVTKAPRTASHTTSDRKRTKLASNLTTEFEACVERINILMQKGTVILVTANGNISAAAGDIVCPRRLLRRHSLVLEREGYLNVPPSDHKDRTASVYETGAAYADKGGACSRWAALSCAPCIVIRADSASYGRLRVYHEGAATFYGTNVKPHAPQGIHWFDEALEIDADAVGIPGLPRDPQRVSGGGPRGRDLQSLERVTAPLESAQMFLAHVTGIPGTGRDALVRAYASRARGRYDAVLWIPGTSSEAAHARLLELCEKLRIFRDVVAVPSHALRLRLFYAALLETYRKTLIIMTSVPASGSPIAAVAPPGAVPPGQSVHFLVGSDASIPDDIAPLMRRAGGVVLDPFSRSQSLRLLRATLGPSSDSKAEAKAQPKNETKIQATLSRLHSVLEGDPLAIRIAVRFLRAAKKRGSLTVNDYASNLISSKKYLQVAKRDAKALPAHYVVVADITRALRNHRPPLLCLSMIAYLDPNGIPISLIRKMMIFLDKSSSQPRIQHAVSLLCAIGVVQRNPQRTHLVMHPHVQRAVRGMVRASRAHATRSSERVRDGSQPHYILNDLVSFFAQSFRFFPGLRRGTRNNRSLFIHALSVTRHALSERIAGSALSRCLALACRLAEYLSTVLLHREQGRALARNTVRVAEAAERKGRGPGTLLTLHCRHTLARMRLVLGDLNGAIDCLGSVLRPLAALNDLVQKRGERVGKRARALWAWAHVDSARVWLATDELSRAESSLRAAYETMRGLSNDIEDRTTHTLALADVRADMSIVSAKRGEFRVAKRGVVRALLVRCRHTMRQIRQASSHAHTNPIRVDAEVGWMCNNLGVLYSRMNRKRSAQRAFEAAYAVQAKINGPSSPEVATVLANWATVQTAFGSLRGSLEGSLAALASRRRFFGNRSLLVAEARHNLGIALWALGGHTCLARARAEVDEALFVKARLYADAKASASLSHSQIAMANVLLDLEQIDRSEQENDTRDKKQAESGFEEAFNMYHEALRSYVSVYGANSMAVSDLHSNIGVALFTQGDYDGAARHHQLALNIRQRIGGGVEVEAKVAASEDAVRVSKGMAANSCVIS